MVAIGAALKRRGFDVIISLSEPYVEVASSAGLTAIPVIATDRFNELLSNANFWKPIRGPRAALREISGEYMPRHLELIKRHLLPGQTVLVSHPLDLASRIYRDTDSTTPLIDIHLAPSMLRTLDAPPRMSPWAWEPSRPEWLIRATYWLADTFAVDPVIAGAVNHLRAQLGLAPVRRIINEWWLSPDRILAMYPEWFAPATEQFRPRLVHCGFPLSDGLSDDFDAPVDRPIVFTGGTAHHHCGDFFERAARACDSLSRPGLLVSTHAANFPAELPDNVRTTRYVSFSSLLPTAAAIVHHGGIGTTSQALAAGIPQLIRPSAFDQFDNAARVERLRCGIWLRRDRGLTDALKHLLDDDDLRQSCRNVAERVEKNGADRAADEIQRYAGQRFTCQTTSNVLP